MMRTTYKRVFLGILTLAILVIFAGCATASGSTNTELDFSTLLTPTPTLTPLDTPDEVRTSGDWTIEIRGAEAAIQHYNGPCGEEENPLQLVVPGEIEGYKITAIADNPTLCYNGSEHISQITLPDTITYIGNAFRGLHVQEIIIPDGVVAIGDSAFTKTALTSVELPNSITYIGNGAFASCAELTSVTLPENLLSLSANLFWGCGKLENVTWPKNLEVIGENAFGWSPFEGPQITELALPNTLVKIDAKAFFGCKALTSVTFPDSLKQIDRMAFSSCTNLTDLYIPANVAVIKYNAFEDCGTDTAKLVIHCADPSAALEYAKAHNIEHVIE